MDPREHRRRRRQQTRAIAQRRRAQHLAAVHPDGDVDCACERAATYFAARSPRGCACRKRKRGRPRLGVGICHTDGRWYVYRSRQRERMLHALVVTWRVPPEDDDISIVL